MGPYKHNYGQIITTDVEDVNVDRGFIAHLQVAASAATVAATAGIHAAVTCSTPAVSASAVVKAATAVTDILTITAPSALGDAANALSVLLTTSEADTLAVSKTDETSIINIVLAKTTASKNTATLIQAAIRLLATVGDVDVSAFTCAAGGNWDTAAVATGEIAAVEFAGGITEVADVVTTAITNPSVPRNITATAGGTGGDIKAVKVIIEGTNYADEPITEELPAFTVNTAGTVVGNKAFKTVTSITIPAHDGAGATTKIGFGEKLGLPYKLVHNTVLASYHDNTLESTAATVVVSATVLEDNTIDINTTLSSKALDFYLIV